VNRDPTKAGERFRVRIEPAGLEFDTDAETPLMAAARAAGIALAASCRNGACRTCMCRLTEGEVAYAIEWPGLAREEQAAGWILPCAALARSPLVIHEPRALRSAAK
jgi:ferredoxin